MKIHIPYNPGTPLLRMFPNQTLTPVHLLPTQHQEESRCLLITTGEYHVQCFCSENE